MVMGATCSLHVSSHVSAHPITIHCTRTTLRDITPERYDMRASDQVVPIPSTWDLRILCVRVHMFLRLHHCSLHPYSIKIGCSTSSETALSMGSNFTSLCSNFTSTLSKSCSHLYSRSHLNRQSSHLGSGLASPCCASSSLRFLSRARSWHLCLCFSCLFHSFFSFLDHLFFGHGGGPLLCHSFSCSDILCHCTTNQNVMSRGRCMPTRDITLHYA